MAAKTVITVSVDTENDRDILQWLKLQPNRSAAIRLAIRQHISRNGVTLGDVYQAIKDLEHKVKAGVMVTDRGDQPDEGNEPPEAAAALDTLANF